MTEAEKYTEEKEKKEDSKEEEKRRRRMMQEKFKLEKALRRRREKELKAIKEQEKKEKEEREKQKQHEKYMRQAIKLAQKAAMLGEVPIGCVIVKDGKVIGRGYNRRNTDKSTLSHAEITAIRKASKKLNDWRLEGCTLYVTLEPCQMCAGAIVQARVSEVVMAAMNPKAGCAGTIYNMLGEPAFNHQVKVVKGVLEEECSQMLRDFFKSLRRRLKTEKTEQKNQKSDD